MSCFVESLALASLLAGACVLTGRLAGAALRVRLTRRAGPEALVASAFLGTGALILAFGWGSHAGLPARACLAFVAAAIAVPAVVLARQGRLREPFAPPARRLAVAAVVVAAGARVVFCLLPLLFGRIYYYFNDTMIYASAAEWLQDHGFGTPAPAAEPHPVDASVAKLQGIGHRMGPVFLLALARAALPGRLALELLPAVMAWGAALNVGGVFLLCRWALRLPRFASAAGALLCATAFNSLCTSVGEGFLCQVYGTAALAFALAVLGKLTAPCHWRPGNAALLGAALATQASVYSELAPVLALAALAAASQVAWRLRGSPRLGRLPRFVGLTLLATLLLGNIEWVRAARAVAFMTGLHGVGRHVRWGDSGYALFGLGYYPVHMFADPEPRPWPYRAAALAAGAAFLAGAAALPRRRPATPLAVALVVFAGLGAFYRLAARDPWTGAAGHSWNLFKIAKWIFPLVSAVQAAGLVWLLRALPFRRALLAATCAGVAALSLPHHIEEGRRVVDGARGLAGGRGTLPNLRKLHRAVRELDPPALYLVSAPGGGPWPRCFPGYFFYPKPFVNGWRGSGFFENPELLDDRPVPPGTLYVQAGEPPFGEPVRRWPGGYSALDPTRPTVFRLDNPNGIERWPRGVMTWLGDRPAVAWVFAPRAGDAVLSFRAEAGPSLPGGGRLTLRVTGTDGTTRAHAVAADESAAVRLPVRLKAGVSRLTLHCADRPTAAAPDDPRVLLLGIIALRLDYADGSAVPESGATGGED